jgi:hypothetical protein
MNFGIELRQRSRSGGSSGDYVRVQTDEWDDDDDDFRYQSMPAHQSSGGGAALRNRRSFFGGSSNRINSEDDEEEEYSPPISNYAQRIKYVPKPPSNTCKLYIFWNPDVLTNAYAAYLSFLHYPLSS